jgi:hypothetical protein
MPHAAVEAGDNAMPTSPTCLLLCDLARSRAADPSLAIATRPEGHCREDPSTLSTAERADWACAYVEAQQDPDLLARDWHPLWWAVERLLLYSACGRFEDCWRLVLDVLRLTRDPEVLGMLAAGALEDLIEHAGPAFVDRIAWQAWTDPAFRRLLESTWPCGSLGIWTRIEAARRMGEAAAGPGPAQEMQ